MKRILTILLLLCMVLSISACGSSGSETDTTETGRGFETVPLDTLDSSPDLKLDNKLLKDDGTLNLTPSDYRIVDETEDGYVIILMNTKYASAIYKVHAFDTKQEAIDLLLKINKEDTVKDYPELMQKDNYVYYKLGAVDATYGKFLMMPREKVLEAFGRTSGDTQAEHDHNH